ncbi:MAG: energy-coupling factor transporter transmembrane protein EcfT [Mycoplasmatota bacterium]
MLNNIKIGKYYYTNSFLHNLNPVLKIIIFCILFILSFISNLYMNIPVFIIIFIIILLSKINIKNYIKTILSLKFLILSLLIINIFFEMELLEIINIILKLINIVNISSILLYTTTINDITIGLNYLLKPLKKIKININELIFTTTLAIRFIPNIIEQTNKILKSQASRGVDYNNSNVKEKITIINSLFIPSFYMSIKKANNLADAMEVRQYDLENIKIKKANKFNNVEKTILLVFLTVFLLGVII